MTSPLLHPAPATVHSADDQAPAYRRRAWDAWLHGRVGAVLRLLVPMRVPTPAAVELALRLYAVGSVELLD